MASWRFKGALPALLLDEVDSTQLWPDGLGAIAAVMTGVLDSAESCLSSEDDRVDHDLRIPDSAGIEVLVIPKLSDLIRKGFGFELT